MKARVKATGEIIEITEDYTSLYAANFDKSYSLDELEFLYVKEKYLPKDEPDYWDKLYHQTAIAAMQGILSSDVYMEVLRKNTISKVSISEDVVRCACDYADTLLKNFKNKK